MPLCYVAFHPWSPAIIQWINLQLKIMGFLSNDLLLARASASTLLHGPPFCHTHALRYALIVWPLYSNFCLPTFPPTYFALTSDIWDNEILPKGYNLH